MVGKRGLLSLTASSLWSWFVSRNPFVLFLPLPRYEGLAGSVAAIPHLVTLSAVGTFRGDILALLVHGEADNCFVRSGTDATDRWTVATSSVVAELLAPVTTERFLTVGSGAEYPPAPEVQRGWKRS